MTNNQAQSYAVLALNELIRQNLISVNTPNIKQVLKTLNSEMSYLFGRLSEEEAEQQALKLFFL